ncbi:acyl carrier protein [Streptomyces actuosus]|uniref:Acyl carrier protein n=1 Tax=Streptomyces actuosus TaxID=1885 RepID=A0ABS2VMP7_STRAS|nr:acyl carrier protein [Streptomyces actuosus]MBN0044357.1 acyl carrier protein [Streptomyces actuosus]
MSTVQEKLTDLLVTQLGVPAAKIEPGISYKDLALDSLALIEFTMILNRELGTDLSDDLLQAETTVAETVEFIEAQGVRA